VPGEGEATGAVRTLPTVPRGSQGPSWSHDALPRALRSWTSSGTWHGICAGGLDRRNEGTAMRWLASLLLIVLLHPPALPAGLLGQGGGAPSGPASAPPSPGPPPATPGAGPAPGGSPRPRRCHGLTLLMFHAFRTLRFREGSDGLSPHAWVEGLRTERRVGPLRVTQGEGEKHLVAGAPRLVALLLTQSLLPGRVEIRGDFPELSSFSATLGGGALLRRLVTGVPTGLGQARALGFRGRPWESNRASSRRIEEDISRRGGPMVVSFVDLKPAKVDLGKALAPSRLLNPVDLLLRPTRGVRTNPGFGEGHTVLVYEAAPFDDRWELLAVDPQLSVKPGEPARVLRIRVWDTDDRIEFHWVAASGEDTREERATHYENLQSMFPLDANGDRMRRGLQRWFLEGAARWR